MVCQVYYEHILKTSSQWHTLFQQSLHTKVSNSSSLQLRLDWTLEDCHFYLLILKSDHVSFQVAVCLGLQTPSSLEEESKQSLGLLSQLVYHKVQHQSVLDPLNTLSHHQLPTNALVFCHWLALIVHCVKFLHAQDCVRLIQLEEGYELLLEALLVELE